MGRPSSRAPAMKPSDSGTHSRGPRARTAPDQLVCCSQRAWTFDDDRGRVGGEWGDEDSFERGGGETLGNGTPCFRKDLLRMKASERVATVSTPGFGSVILDGRPQRNGRGVYR